MTPPPPPPPPHLFTVLEAPMVDDTEDRDPTQVDPDWPATLVDSHPEALLDFRDSHQK
jgi:hypothetical protein